MDIKWLANEFNELVELGEVTDVLDFAGEMGLSDTDVSALIEELTKP